MSVLVKGMEMPKSCVVCKFGSFYQSTHGLYCGILTKDIKGSVLCRPDWCPLVEVPAHGRLIDAEAVKDMIKKSLHEDISNWLIEDVDKQPTVIPAEEAANCA